MNWNEFTNNDISIYINKLIDGDEIDGLDEGIYNNIFNYYYNYYYNYKL